MYSLQKPKTPKKSLKQIMHEQKQGDTQWPSLSSSKNSSKKRNKNKNKNKNKGELIEQNKNQTQNNENQAPLNSQEQLDEDFVLALQLQEQFDMEEQMMFEQQQKQQHQNKQSKLRFEKVVSGNKVSNKQVVVSSDRLIDRLQLLDGNSEINDEQQDDDYEDDMYEDDMYDEEERYVKSVQAKAYHQGTKVNGRVPKSQLVTKHDPTVDSIRKAQRLEGHWSSNNLGDMKGKKISAKIYNDLNKFDQKEQKRRIRKNTKEQIATHEGVMDPRTRLILYKMLNNGILKVVNGCISTGKEASVYHSYAEDEQVATNANNPKEQQLREKLPYFSEYAIKIFKTTKNEFKTRQKYMEGQHRFRNKLSKQNPRKMIKLWAEKEMRNLKRISKVESINSPVPVLLREHILIMQFIGVNGKHAPQLKQVNFSPKRLVKVYKQVVLMIRDLFQKCHLVHADLSPYNMLYFKKKVYMIDLAAAVESDSQNALEFLRNDCENITEWFLKCGLQTILSIIDLFKFVTDSSIKQPKETLEQLLKDTKLDNDNKSIKEQSRTNVFKDAFIPQRLNQVSDPFSEYQQISKEGSENVDVFHFSLTGMKGDLSGPVDN